MFSKGGMFPNYASVSAMWASREGLELGNENIHNSNEGGEEGLYSDKYSQLYSHPPNSRSESEEEDSELSKNGFWKEEANGGGYVSKGGGVKGGNSSS